MREPTMQDIEPLMDEFDFEKVHKVMWSVDWTWAYPEPAHVPTVDELKTCVRGLWEHVVAEKGGCSRSGGFEVYCYAPDSEESCGECGIKFWLERVFLELY